MAGRVAAGTARGVAGDIREVQYDRKWVSGARSQGFREEGGGATIGINQVSTGNSRRRALRHHQESGGEKVIGQ